MCYSILPPYGTAVLLTGLYSARQITNLRAEVYFRFFSFHISAKTSKNTPKLNASLFRNESTKKNYELNSVYVTNGVDISRRFFSVQIIRE